VLAVERFQTPRLPLAELSLQLGPLCLLPFKLGAENLLRVGAILGLDSRLLLGDLPLDHVNPLLQLINVAERPEGLHDVRLVRVVHGLLELTEEVEDAIDFRRVDVALVSPLLPSIVEVASGDPGDRPARH
jgi:hypothetical protein